jgi:membrane fusion protein, multidrug efflux system
MSEQGTGGGRRPRITWRDVPEIAWRALVFIVALILLLIVVTRWNRWQGGAGVQTTDDAYLQADVTPIAAKVPGYLRAVPGQDFQRVRGGDLIAQVVDDDYRAAFALAEANVAAASAQLDILKAQYTRQKADVDAANAALTSTKANFAQNTRDVARQRVLLATGSSSTEAGEKLDTTRSQLSAQLAQNNAQVEAATRQLAVLTAQETQATAAIAAQKANLDTARINLGYTSIVAPQDGVLGQRQVRPGQYVGVGGQITTLTPLPHVWVIANYKETQLTHMAVGQRAEIRVDTFPGRVMHGHIQSFSPASGAVFALLPPDNATGNFTKVVQRIAVKIVIDDAAGLTDLLRPGMSVVTSVDAHAEVPR